MEFDQLINDGWSQHHTDTSGVADKLEAHLQLADNAERATSLAALARHVLGEHLGDWPRAERALVQLASRITGADNGAPLLGHLAATHYLSGNWPAALAAETRVAAASGSNTTEALGQVLRIRFLVAGALHMATRVDECISLYDATLALAASTPDLPAVAARAAAITSNNVASELVEREQLDDAEAKLMVMAADAARTYWLQVGNKVNDERGDYLLALVHTRLGTHDTAVHHAARGLTTIADHAPDETVDEAFLSLQQSRAQRGLGDGTAADASLAHADELAEAFDNDGLKSWFATERAKVTG